MYTCVIIDDEEHAIQTLTGYLSRMPEFHIVKCFTDPVLAMIFLKDSDRIDLLFMDIDMPNISGLELAREVGKKADKLIFTTAHTQYAFDAFEINASDYLLKPIGHAKFISTIKKAFPNPTQEAKPELGFQNGSDNYFFIKSREDNLKMLKIKYDEVVAIESKLNYINIHTLQKSIFTYMSLTEISKTLSEKLNFVQFQRSFILNLDFIESIEGNSIYMETGLKINVGDYYKNDFNNFIKEHLIRAKRR